MRDAAGGGWRLTPLADRIEAANLVAGRVLPVVSEETTRTRLAKASTRTQGESTVGADTAIAVAGDAVVIPPGIDHAICYHHEPADIVGVLAGAHAALNTPAE